MTNRREWIAAATAATFGALLAQSSLGSPWPAGAERRRRIVKPSRIQAGDTIGLMIPASANWDPNDVDVLLESLAALGLKGKLGKHVFDRYG